MGVQLIGEDWRDPDGPWTLTVNGEIVPESTILVAAPGREFRVKINTMCGLEQVDVTADPVRPTPQKIFARQIQIVSSIQHVMRRACVKCRSAYYNNLTPFEKKFLYTTEPKLGPILGIATPNNAADLSVLAGE